MDRINVLPEKRIYTIDLMRGLTILLMVFVNEVAGMRDIPGWLKHMPADADAMTVTDWVFPGFLFIVGMSIPLAINHRIRQGDDFWQIQKHILIRTIGLLILGVFMVNAEGGYNEAAMGIPIGLWSLIFYPAVILVWNDYKIQNRTTVLILKGLGIGILLLLAFIYRAGDGSEYLKPRWWGILGLIGWAYLFATIFYQIVKGNKFFLLVPIALCLGVYALSKSTLAAENIWLSWTEYWAGHATHTLIVLSGIVLTLIFFEERKISNLNKRFIESILFAGILFMIGFWLRPYFQVSKIWATPSWGLYSAAFAIIAFCIIYWLIDIKGHKEWTRFFQPAGSNPLLTYILPFIFWALYRLFDFYPLPGSLREGLIGIFYCILYAIFILFLVKLLNRLGIRLKL